MIKLFFILLTLNCVAQSAGSLDSNYGMNGVFQDCDNTSFLSFGLKNQSSGKLIYNGRFNTLRINQNGSLDTTFGTNGFLNWFNVSGIGSNPSIEIQNDDKFILYSRKSNGSAWISSVVRFLPNGQLDTDFGTNGKIDLTIIQNTYISESVKQLSDGKILVVGNTSGSYNQFTIVRLNSNGSIDTTFGVNGKAEVQFNLPTTEQQATCLVILPNGSMIVGGVIAINGIGYRTALIKLSSTGILDATFGTNGKTVTPYGTDDFITNMYLLNDGSIITTGRVQNPGSYSRSVAIKYNSSGILDTSYGINGFSELPIYEGGGGFSAQQIDGKIILPIISGLSAIFRLNNNGTIDTTFGVNGYYINTNLGDSNGAGANSIAIQSDNKILVGTTTTNSDNSGLCAVVLRLNPGVLNATTFSNEINLFPNPTTNEVYFDNSGNIFSTVSVFNTLGQELKKSVLGFSNNETINLSNYQNGAYFLKFSNENSSVTSKIIKQ